jgi:hypothetical protein
MLPNLSGLAVVSGPAAKRRRSTVDEKVVPKEKLDAFLESMVADELQSLWETRAVEMLPQYPGVEEGDWKGAGYNMEKEFPMVFVLAKDYGKEWEEYSRIYTTDKVDGVVWLIDGMEKEDFETLLEDFLGEKDFRDLYTKEEVDKTIKEFQYTVRNKMEE